MTNFTKQYLGKGTQIEGFEIIKVSLPLAELEKICYEYDGIEYVSFEVAKLKVPTKWGKTHTVYTNVKGEQAIGINRKYTPDVVLDECLKIGRIVASGSWYKHEDKNIAHGRKEMLALIAKDDLLYEKLTEAKETPAEMQTA